MSEIAENPYLNKYALPSGNHQQLLAAIAALADGLRLIGDDVKRTAGIGWAREISDRLQAVENKLEEVDKARRESDLAVSLLFKAIEQKLERIEAMADAGRLEQRLESSLKFSPQQKQRKRKRTKQDYSLHKSTAGVLNVP